jgi:hypothetical protein
MSVDPVESLGSLRNCDSATILRFDPSNSHRVITLVVVSALNRHGFHLHVLSLM